MLEPTWSTVGPRWSTIVDVNPAVNFTGDAIGEVSITRGRDTVYLDPPASYARIQLLDYTGLGLNVNISQPLVVDVLDSAGDPLTVFRGYITDVSADLYDAGLGSTMPAAIYSIYAVGPLARLSRTVVLAGGRPAETDSDRVTAALAGDPDYDPSLIDPGVFDLVALDPSDLGYTALEVATSASNSGEGLLYETLAGRLGWANADARNTATNPTVIPANSILAFGVRSSSSLSDLVNQVTVEYDGGSETAQDPISIATYTLFERRLSTILANQSSAEDRADTYVERHAYPAVNLGEIAIRLDAVTDDTLRDDLMQLYSGSPVRLPDLPQTIGIRRLDGFVEGTSLRLDRLTAELRLNISDAALSRSAVRWTGVGPTIRWQDVSATLEWQDATTVTT
jgi:hypothetical protein